MKIRNYLRQLAVSGLATLIVAPQVGAQPQPVFTVPEANVPYSAADMRVLVGPVALYADDLIGIILPASTYPLQIVQAQRFLDRLRSDSTAQPDPDWDDSVIALLNYPEIVELMDTNIEWTWALGESVLDDQSTVLAAIQDFRQSAMNAGNLASTDQYQVSQNDGRIEIAPANPEVIHIPYYEPERVVVYQPRPVVHFYSHAYPLYYYPYPVGYRFRTNFFWGVSTAFDIGWHSHVLHIYDYHHYAHPFYGRRYHAPWYQRHRINVHLNYDRNVWHPRTHRASRPHRTTVRTVNIRGDADARSQRGTRTTTTRTQTERTRATQPRTARGSDNAAVNRGTQTREPTRSTRTPLLGRPATTRAPGSVQPRATQPRSTQQGSTQQGSTQQRSIQQRATQQRATQQRMAQPRTTQQRSTRQPAAQPRSVQPRSQAPQRSQPSSRSSGNSGSRSSGGRNPARSSRTRER